MKDYSGRIYYRENTITPGVGPPGGILFSANTKRIGLILSVSCDGSAVNYSFQSGASAPGAGAIGLNMPAGSSPIVLFGEPMMGIVTAEVRAACAAGKNVTGGEWLCE